VVIGYPVVDKADALKELTVRCPSVVVIEVARLIAIVMKPGVRGL
jgi:hypothetical protein